MTEQQFSITGGQVAFRESCFQLARDVLGPIAGEGRPGHVNRALVAALGERNLIGEMLRLERSESERPISTLQLCLVREGLARACPEAETALALQGLGGYPLIRWGSRQVREDWGPRLVAGSAIAAFALTEPDAGSDVGALSLAAVRDGDGFRLTGTKVFISNAPDADIYTLFARTSGESGARGITAFAVPGDTPGLSGERLELVSPHPIGRLALDGVHLGHDQVLGEVDRGFGVAMETLGLFRPSVGAFALGMAQCALDAAVQQVKDRHLFGRPLAEMQAVAHKLADLATQLEAARLLVYHAAARADAAGPDPTSAAMAKLFATETAQAVVDAAVQFHGARGLVVGHPLEHLYRDVRTPRIYEGASEIQREIISRALLRDS
jgi:alkylation response protein AidB-like acyl-CoA dehydrogenase